MSSNGMRNDTSIPAMDGKLQVEEYILTALGLPLKNEPWKHDAGDATQSLELWGEFT